MTKTDNFRDVISKMIEAVTLDDKGNLTVVNKTAMAEADELLNQLVVETARNWWAQLESAEDSLANMADEISFAELNTDPSHMATPAIKSPKPMAAAPAMEAALGGPEFDLRGIFEMTEDDGDMGPRDGDDGYDDLMRGDDEAGIGDSAPTDGELDLDGGDELDAMGDDGMGDDFGASDDGLDGGGDGEFDFSFLDDQGDDFDGDDLGSDFGGDQGDGDLGGDDLGGEFGDDDQGDDLGGFQQ